MTGFVDFLDFLDSLAGMMGFIFEVAVTVLGSYVFWQQMTLRCFDLYKEETDPLGESPIYKSCFTFYVRNFSAISGLFTCCNKSERNTKLVAELVAM